MSSGLYRAVGLMSGTSMDGIDAALIETDGESHVRPLGFLSVPYADTTREKLRASIERALAIEMPGADPVIDAAAQEITALHADAVRALLKGAPADVVGFHGQTIAHRPERGWTWQIGDGAGLAQTLGIPVVADLRSADVAAGGQGAPLLPVYHRALASGLGGPVAVLNLGGVGNITFLGADDAMIAFDTGPANALIDDWVLAARGLSHDAGGAIAASGVVHEEVLARMAGVDWFAAPPPKSLDRQAFSLNAVSGLSFEDGAATLTAFTAETVRLGLDHLPARPARLLVTGGGRHNATLMRMLAARTGIPADPVEAVGWRGDAMEAEGFAYMAVRRLCDLPISFPGTTGVPAPTVGGIVFRS
ncbi:anhydro-N-acetylmuramic acid kinase [Sphingosinicella soli]|uniref:Anhydro-N-acetylmuramic acid kinase n=1 Tax=Sphingosinicella soli TaxID=333708 RepID=A0A7W7B213_9SPHN|nr:anhydro-N-acetylmuramic acid kinase [Sphingosinicella soli]MBB4632531.1 anhydro-N-acetylmuramic acid kinase [Sphingosinicella soli]